MIATIKSITRRLKKACASALREPVPAPTPVRATADNAMIGRLNFRNAVLLRKRLWALLERAPRAIALRCDKVSFMDSAALATTIEFALACRAQGISLRLVEPTKRVWNAFSLYGLSSLLRHMSEIDDRDFDEGMLIILEEDFDDSIRLPALKIVEQEYEGEIKLPPLKAAA